jgi:protein gp37
MWRRHGPRRMLSEANWERPLRWNRDAERAGIPAKVFCASMADVFEDHPDVAAPRERLWGLIEATPWLAWQLLTKRPENIAWMVPWGSEWPRNVWVGTSVENQRYADKRIPILVNAASRARIRFLSCEPLLGPVDLSPWLFPDSGSGNEPGCGVVPPLIDWVICGGESGPKARPTHPSWARSLRDQCDSADVPFFFKQWGEWGLQNGVAWPFGDAWQNPHRHCRVSPDDGRAKPFGEFTGTDDLAWAHMKRVGKKAAGRELDGQVCDEFPRHLAGAGHG